MHSKLSSFTLILHSLIMQFKTVAVLTIASLAAASADVAPPAGVVGQKGNQPGTTVIQEEQGGQQQGAGLNNPLGPAGAIAAAIWGCFTGWLGTA